MSLESLDLGETREGSGRGGLVFACFISSHTGYRPEA